MQFNKEEFKWFLILSALAYYFNYLLSTGKIYDFIHPRMIIYVRIAFYFLIILCIIQIKRIFTVNEKKKISLNVFLIPVVIVFLLNPQRITSNMLSMKSSVANSTGTYKSDIVFNKNRILSKADIIIGDNNYTSVTDKIIYGKPKKYIGKTIQIKGFIYHDKQLAKNQFMIARLLMVCCAADTEIDGVICTYDKASFLTENAWMTVTGKLNYKKIKYYGETSLMPVIEVNKLSLAKKPKHKYVYPE
ncbi:TIGR03943 family putative permease subunit [Clostridium oryzae]|uniref:Putative two-component membrane permease complex subunit n=1 Tax=Clostridium oryzae TaxID=1450648 RepID=A0A1V4II24_9CLOT|nr:TIGR03943 family protein [Clostridium oryzae]OPJ59569.1 putative two-component membrane permease complex subunit [Clostridium oryzae]